MDEESLKAQHEKLQAWFHAYVNASPEEKERRLREHNERYDAWFFAPETKRQYDAMMDACAPPNFLGYADPDSPRGRRIRGMKPLKGERREPRRGPRQVRILKGQLSSKQRYAIFERDSYRCRLCGAFPEEDDVKLHVDHIIPRVKGGSNDPKNLWTLCSECNIGKGTQDL